jgi:uncharacterized membrane protein YbhN (UPF0104 family)
MTVAVIVAPRRRWLPWVGALIGLGALAWVLRRFDLDRFLATLAGADLFYLLLVPISLITEQLVRAWKWRQILSPLKLIGTLRLFGAVMAGYLIASLIPFGFGSVARSWIVARNDQLKLPAVLATVGLDRITDGVVFACLVPVALLAVVFPDPTGGIRTGLIWSGAGSLALFVLVAFALLIYKRGMLSQDSLVVRLIDRLPARLSKPCRRLATSFSDGIVWPQEMWRGAGILLASIAIKLLAASHFLWAGLAFGVVLEPAQYVFVLVFLGFLIILGHFARVAGSFIIGGIFALGLMEVPQEQALAMVLVVEAANLFSIAALGALSIWRQGIALAELRATDGVIDVRADAGNNPV